MKDAHAVSLKPKLDILPPSQRLLWQELKQTPRSFVLYGGTAIALRLGHRQSLDFDFFCNETFDPSELFRSVPYLQSGRVDQRTDNTLSVIVERKDPVRVSFFRDLGMKRAEAKDYFDIAAGIAAGVSLSEALGAAIAIYGKTCNAMTALKALTYFGDGNLPSLPSSTQQRLRAAAEAVKLDALPHLAAKPGIVRQDV